MNSIDIVLSSMRAGCIYRPKDVVLETGLSESCVRESLKKLDKGMIVINLGGAKRYLYVSLQERLF